MIDRKVKDLTSQSEIVVKQLMIYKKMTRNQALTCWYTSKTKRILEEKNMYYVSGIRCYVELIYEITNNSKWMNEPFE